jgi:nicotinate-nucleotide adenylyltransferase
MQNRAKRRIGLFGGTFDPIHSGHLRIADEALRRFELDRVLFVPAANPPHKQSAEMTAYADRLRMVELACEPYPKFLASSLESGPEKSYTVDTLERAHGLYPQDELLFLIGADAFAEIETWKRWRDVLKLTQFVVISRPGVSYSVPAGARVHRLDGIEIPISSSAIRGQLEQGRPAPELPPAVFEYIRERGLYGQRPAEATVSQ